LASGTSGNQDRVDPDRVNLDRVNPDRGNQDRANPDREHWAGAACWSA